MDLELSHLGIEPVLPLRCPQSCLNDLRNALGESRKRSGLRTRFLNTFHQWKSINSGISELQADRREQSRRVERVIL